MPRKKSPDARNVTMSARFSEAEAALIDAQRGEAERSVWLRERALSGLAAPESVAEQQGTQFLPDGTPASEQVRPPDPNRPRY